MNRGSRAYAGLARANVSSDPGFVDAVYPLGPVGVETQTQVRIVYASSPSHDPFGTWLSLYSPWEMVFGLDIEWKPNRPKRQNNPAALLQIAGRHGCILIQLLRLDWLPASLVNFLLDRNVKLGGVGIHQDCAKLYRDFYLDVRAEKVELSKQAAIVLSRPDLKQAGMSSLCLEIWGEHVRKDKRVTLSNWESEQLSLEQIIYAATDALMSPRLLLFLSPGGPSEPCGRSRVVDVLTVNVV